MKEDELNKYFKSETVELYRSEIQLAGYNPRKISNEARKQLKGSLKKYGVVGGLVVNKTTSNTLVSGHQKVSILDELNNFPENDYKIKVELIEVDEKTEKELNIFFNNPNAMGSWDYDILASIIPDIDYKNAGLTEQDLSIIGIDISFDVQNDIVADFQELSKPYEEMKDHVKNVKAEVRKQSNEMVDNHETYVSLVFKNTKAKESFLQRFGFTQDSKFIQGEEFANMVERIG
ncbi:DNA methylase [Dysgonomonas sp. 521]|uniref:DNA methylase n=1 Tax=Dysgonomonas sp. 521 TaxID=2302932 RepID=UPI0013D831E3|nr:DNA methylase [Dysgonomonas sp. 521]NDV93475.1 DNA methylase [Dysgonomonas sp. 521]